jgi:hypothetical protein
MNVLKEGKTYYLSSMNSQYPLIPCDEALQYLKSTLMSETQEGAGGAGVGEGSSGPTSTLSPLMTGADLMTTYTPSNGYFSLPFSMVPIHTQSVLYPSMQYFPPPLSSVLHSTLMESSSQHYSMMNEEEGQSDSTADESSEEFITSTSAGPGSSEGAAGRVRLGGVTNLLPQTHEPPIYELSLPFQYYPVFPSERNDDPSGLYSALSSLPMILPSSSEIHSSSSPGGSFLSENPTALLKRTRDEYENCVTGAVIGNQEQLSESLYLLPHLLPTLTKSN